MRAIYIILLAVMLAFIVTVVVVSLGFSIPETQDQTFSKSVNAQYHFVMIGQNTDEAFNAKVHSGALEAAADYNVAVEINDVRPSDVYSAKELFDKALDSHVDGIAIQLTDDGSAIADLAKAAEMNIPVVTFETDSATAANIPTIGTNNFRAGLEAGKLAIKCTNGKANVAVILNGLSSQDENPQKNLRISGMSDAFKNYPDMKITVVQRTEGGIFGAEKATKDILRDYPDVNLIVATNEMDTLGIIDVVVDSSKLDRVSVIGYGAQPETIKYIKSGVLYGTVVSDSQKIGYESIKSLVDLHKSGYSTSFNDTGVFTYTRENVDEYKETE